MISTVVWGTGNVGRAAIRAVDAHPALDLAAVLVHNPDKVGRDAGDLGDLGREIGIRARADIDAVLSEDPAAIVYAATGEIRPDDAFADILRALRTGAVVVTPALFPLYDHRSAPPEMREPVLAAIEEAGGSLFVSGIDPGGATTCCRCCSADSARRSTASAARRSSITRPTTSPTRCGTSSGWGSRWTTNLRCSRRRSRRWCGADRCG